MIYVKATGCNLLGEPNTHCTLPSCVLNAMDVVFT